MLKTRMAIYQHSQVLLKLTASFRHYHHLLIFCCPQHLLTLVTTGLVVAFHGNSTGFFQALYVEIGIFIIVDNRFIT